MNSKSNLTYVDMRVHIVIFTNCKLHSKLSLSDYIYFYLSIHKEKGQWTIISQSFSFPLLPQSIFTLSLSHQNSTLTNFKSLQLCKHCVLQKIHHTTTSLICRAVRIVTHYIGNLHPGDDVITRLFEFCYSARRNELIELITFQTWQLVIGQNGMLSWVCSTAPVTHHL